MNVNEFLSPLIAVSSQGYRKLRPTQGEGHRNLISARVRSLLANKLGVRSSRYAAYRNMPRPFGGAEKRGRLDPEVLYVGAQMGANFGPEYQKFYKERFVDIVNGSWKMWDNVKEWGQKARASMFRTGLGQITDDVQCWPSTTRPSTIPSSIPMLWMINGFEMMPPLLSNLHFGALWNVVVL